MGVACDILGKHTFTSFTVCLHRSHPSLSLCASPKSQILQIYSIFFSYCSEFIEITNYDLALM